MRNIISCLLLGLLLQGCSSFISSSGPSRREVNQGGDSAGVTDIQILNVDAELTKRLVENRKQILFSEIFNKETPLSYNIGPGDVIEVLLWEAPPKALFTGEESSAALPQQMVNEAGEINIPFAGQVKVGGLSIREIEKEISKRLKGKANQPQVMVRVINNNTNRVTLVGDVNLSREIPLTYRGERLLDALASGGGVKQEVNKTTLQITRGSQVFSLPLDTIIKDPLQNIRLMPGDIITSLYKSYSFSVLGATGQNSEINFEAQGISLAQALARSGGLNDNRADAEGVFLFRFERPETLNLDPKKFNLTPEGRIPVIYKVDLKDPATFLLAQNFPMEHQDLLYVATSSQAQLQKFLNLIQSVAFSTLGVINLQNTLDKTLNN